MLGELACIDCSCSFSSAASLLQHFAEHASNVSKSIRNTNQVLDLDELPAKADTNTIAKPVLNHVKKVSYTVEIIESEDKSNDSKDIKSVLSAANNEEENVDSGVEDVNPLQYCAVTLKTDSRGHLRKRYDCTFCFKSFGWSTDLKRHILIHTGERPFQCSLCDSTFTRKFLLQKHLAKLHYKQSNPTEIPSQELYLKQKNRKQDKQCIKHNAKMPTHI